MGLCFFSANTASYGRELWKSDGTSAGTMLVKDIRAGAIGSTLTNFTAINEELFFSVNHPSYGTELWKTDGTSAGTTLVKDIIPGSTSSDPLSFITLDETLYFIAFSSDLGRELWKSDGTSGGTTLVKDFAVSGSGSIETLRNLNGTIYFAANNGLSGNELWISDGTEQGTQMVKDQFPEPGDGISSPSQFIDVNGTLFFTANHFQGLELWTSDGTPEGTNIVKDLFPGSKGSSPSNLENVNGTLFFSANHPDYGIEIWMTDGTEEGTVLLKDLDPDRDRRESLTNVNGTLYFVADVAGYGTELWKSDGTAAGTSLVKDITPGFYTTRITYLRSVGELLFFLTGYSFETQRLWVTDGTSEGTRQVMTVRPYDDYSSSHSFVNMNGTLYFNTNDGAHGYELWMSDGTSAGTEIVTDILPGISSGLNDDTELIVAQDQLFFSANNGQELWVTDGTSEGTQFVKSFPTSSFIPFFGYGTVYQAVGDKLFFGDYLSLYSTQIWQSDGTPEGTVVVTDFDGTYDFEELTNGSGRLFFMRERYNTDIFSLYMTDGTLQGTHLIHQNATIDDEVAFANPIEVGGKLYYSVWGNNEDRELWVYDIPPYVTITPDQNSISSGSFLFTFEFNEDVSDFDIEDIIITNGIAGSFQIIDDKTFTLVVTPIKDGDVLVTVPDDAAFDSVGGGNFEASGKANFDTIPPTLEITPSAVASRYRSMTFTFEFSEAVTGFTADDIVLTNAVTLEFMQVTPSTYTLRVNAQQEGEVTATVADGAAQDKVGFNSSSATGTAQYDLTPPTLIPSPEIIYTNANPYVFTLEFSEAITRFTEEDLYVSFGAEIISFGQIDEDTYSVEFGFDAYNIITRKIDIWIFSWDISDLAGNVNTETLQTYFYFDNRRPSLDITPTDTVTNSSDPIQFTFQFSEDVTGFDLEDIEVIYGAPGGLISVDENTYTLEVTPTSDGMIEVIVEEETAEDFAGNVSRGAIATVLVDTISPTLFINPPAIQTNSSPILFTFDFTEDVTGFAVEDIQVNGGVASQFTVIDFNTYTLEVIPNSDGELTVSVDAGVAFDGAYNDNLASSATVTFDGTDPTLVITPDSLFTNESMVLFTFSFSEEVSDFGINDINLINATAGSLQTINGSTFRLEVSPESDGEVMVSVAAAAAHDEAGNGNDSSTATIQFDATAPTLFISSPNAITNSNPIHFTFEFSEAIHNFTSNDIVLAGGSVDEFSVIDDKTFAIEVIPDGDGDITATVASGAAQDAATNDSTGDMATVTYDGTPPTVAVTPDNLLTNMAFIVFTFHFSEEVFDFTVEDVSVTNGTKGTFTAVDGDTYSLEVTAVADGDVIVTAEAGGATDAASNGNQIGSATVTHDGTAPTLEITPDSGESNDSPILFTFLFSEEVIGFDASDIMVTGGAKGTFTTVDGDSYTLEITPDEEDGDVTVTVADGVAQDGAMNDNVGDSATVTYNATEPTPLIVTGTDAGGPATVRVFDPSGNELLSFMPYGAFTGGVRVATGDVNGDGILDIITAAGPGGGPHVQVFDSRTGQLITGGLNNFYAYAPNVTTGVFVAVGDVNDDGYDDIITAPDAGGGPHLKVYNGLTGEVITEFYAYAPNVTVGVRIATGDINGDGLAEIITTPGPGGGPHVRVINGMTGEQMPGPVTNFYAYAPNVFTRLYVASGDVNGDGFDDIITSPGAGGGPHVQAFSSADGSTLQNFYAYHPNFLGGVRVGSADLNQDGFTDILTVPGTTGGPHTRAFSGTDLSDIANFYSGPSDILDGLFIAGGISYIPIEDPAPTSAPFTSPVITSNPETPEDLPFDNLAKKKSWQDDADEFFQSAEEIDKLFSGLGIE
ncbi:Hypothetical protein PBC10988_32500 [Planctomycetales bacterium 10988]|nr:Hypothetical protein PBC10988_32500 [Planctomycetales bacterium 10988]